MKAASSMRLLTLCLAVLLMGLSSSGSANSDSVHGALMASIRLSEQRIDRGVEQVPLLFGSIPQDVDINSIIRIRIDGEVLNRHLNTDTVSARGQAEASKWRPILKQAENMIRSAATAVDVANDAAIRAIEAEARGPEAYAQLREFGGRSEAAFGEFVKQLVAYQDSLKSAPDFVIRSRGEQLSARFNVVSDKIEAGKERYIASGITESSPEFNVASANLSANVVLEFLNDELEWLQAQQRQAIAVIREELDTVALALVARSASQDGNRLHIEYYDELPPGEIVYLDKINWTEDSRAMQDMLEAVRPVVTAMEDLRTRRIDTAEAIGRIMNANGIDVQSVVRAVDDLDDAVANLREKDWQLEIERMRLEIEAILSETPADPQQLWRAWNNLRDAVKAAEDQIRSLETRERVQTLKDLANADVGTSDPIDALTTFLGQIDDSVASTRAWIDGLEAIKNPLNTTIAKLETLLNVYGNFAGTVAQLPSSQQEKLNNTLSNWTSSTFADVRDKAKTFKTESAQLIDALKQLNANAKHRQRLASQLRLYANLDFPIPDDILYVLGDRLKDTFIDLRTLPQRQDGSVVLLDAYLYRLDPSGSNEAGKVKVGAQLDRGRQQFVLHRYGWYSTPNVGVAYVSSRDIIEDQDTRSKQFTAQASWLFRHRAWATSEAESTLAGMAAKPLLAPKPWYEDIGVGPHIVAMDLNKDSQQEVGLGVTFSFFDDVLQVGYGWNITLDEDQYYFVGLKLLQFGSTMGVQTHSSSGTFQTGNQ